MKDEGEGGGRDADFKSQGGPAAGRGGWRGGWPAGEDCAGTGQGMASRTTLHCRERPSWASRQGTAGPREAWVCATLAAPLLFSWAPSSHEPSAPPGEQRCARRAALASAGLKPPPTPLPAKGSGPTAGRRSSLASGGSPTPWSLGSLFACHSAPLPPGARPLTRSSLSAVLSTTTQA